MNPLFAVALGGSFGAVLRYLVSAGVAHWLGRDFPYGTLTVNIVGSFLLGLLTEALVLNRIALALDYRAAILVGFIGAFTTFSTFSLDTVYLLQQGQLTKALVNVLASVLACLLAVWLGLVCGKAAANALLPWMGGQLPIGLLCANAFGALLIAILTSLLLSKTALPAAYAWLLWITLIGTFLSLSSLYLVLFSLEQNDVPANRPENIGFLLCINLAASLGTMGVGWWLVKSLNESLNA